MKRLESIQIMRGIAATMVMVHHFTYANPKVAALFPAFTGLFKYSSLGVWMFFDLGLRYSLCNVFNQLSDKRRCLALLASANRPA
ncbi:MAG TPA: hypothetical protein VHZ64_17730 [Xanthobacteraceae bacterium]|jgi:hypothetical protein|nr:hypothetical protein [Xanthobacteraceae bacterium]